jgi:hypothetical protein
MFASMSGRLGSAVLAGLIVAGLLTLVTRSPLDLLAGAFVAVLVWFAHPRVLGGKDESPWSTDPKFPPSLRARERAAAAEQEQRDHQSQRPG